MIRVILITVFAFLLTVGHACPTGTITYQNNGNGNYTFVLHLDYSGTSFPLTTATFYYGDGDSTIISPSGNPDSLIFTHQYPAPGSTNVSFYALIYGETSTIPHAACANYTSTIVLTLGTIIDTSQCPVSAFVPNKTSGWCNTGEYTLAWANCQPAGQAYWTAQYVVWNMGDGTTITTQGMDTVTHTYTNAGTVQITATAYFIGQNGELCSTNLIYIPNMPSNGDPCGYLFGTNSIYPYLEIDTYVAIPDLYTSTGPFCQTDLVSFFDAGSISPSGQNMANWSYQLYMDGNLVLDNPGLPGNTTYFTQSTLPSGDHLFELVYTYEAGGTSCTVSDGEIVQIDSCVVDTCQLCLNFAPEVGNRYWISGWVKEAHSTEQKTYASTALEVEFIGSSTTSINFTTSGSIIEGWQRIVGSFTVPYGTTDLNVNLVNYGTHAAYFDDIRVHPFSANVKSYVYDPVTLLLTAELDDNNYATFYEYDQEGNLTRIKKETSRGIMTIQESRSSNPKN